MVVVLHRQEEREREREAAAAQLAHRGRGRGDAVVRAWGCCPAALRGSDAPPRSTRGDGRLRAPRASWRPAPHGLPAATAGRARCAGARPFYLFVVAVRCSHLRVVTGC